MTASVRTVGPRGWGRRCLFRGVGTVAPRARWQGREYDYLGWAAEFAAYEGDDGRAVLCDDAGDVIVVDGDAATGDVERRCLDCGRWSEHVQVGYGRGDEARVGMRRVLRVRGGPGVRAVVDSSGPG